MWITVTQFILSISILVVLHEFGHYLPAKWFKTRVEKFYLFFDPYFSLFKKQIGETEWGIGWLPLGGYVKISGMIDESFDKEQMKGEPQPWEFRSKPAWQRLIIMLGGVIVNFILGFLIFGFIFFKWGQDYIPVEAVKDGIYVDAIGAQLGLQDGDKIIRVGDKTIEKFGRASVVSEIVFNDAQTMVVERGGQQKTLNVDPSAMKLLTTYDNRDSLIFGPRVRSHINQVNDGSKASALGLQAGDKILSINGVDATYFHDFKESFARAGTQQQEIVVLREIDTIRTQFTVEQDELLGFTVEYPETVTETFTFGPAMKKGFSHGVNFLKGQISAFGKMFTGKIAAKDSLGSFISIGSQFGTSWDWRRFWNMTAMLSLILAFLNLLPIPALDGGHVMFLIWETVTGRKPSEKVLEYSTLAGFILLIIFMIYALGLDVMRVIR